MSIQVIQLAQYTKKLTLSEYCVLISLASFADKDDGLCWPSLETIAAISNVEKKTAIRAIRRLTAPYNLPDPRPLVSIVENRKVKVRNNTYQLNLPLLQELQESRTKGVPTTPQRKNAVGVSVATTQTQVEAECDIKDREEEIGDQARVTSTPSSVISTTTEGDIDDSLYRRTVKEPLLEPKTRTVSANPRALARRESAYLTGVVHGDLKPLAVQIALRHPRSRMRQWTSRNVGLADRQAILDAIADDAKQQGMEMADVGRAMLLSLDAWDDVPKDRWGFVAAIPKFFREGDYRFSPEDLPGITRAKEGASNGKRRGSNEEAFRGFIPEPITADSDGEGVEAAGGHVGSRPDEAGGGSLPGVPVGVRSTGVDPDLHAGNGRVQVLPTPRHSARIQWPTRVR